MTKKLFTRAVLVATAASMAVSTIAASAASAQDYGGGPPPPPPPPAYRSYDCAPAEVRITFPDGSVERHQTRSCRDPDSGAWHVMR